MVLSRWARCLLSFCFLFFLTTAAFAEIVINVVAVNGSDEARESEVNFSLPGELEREDILDTAGLQVDYDINNAGYYVHGMVNLGPKETKTFRVTIRDIWRITDDMLQDIESKIEQGAETLAVDEPADKTMALKNQLNQEIDLIYNEYQSAESVEGRMDAFRSYVSQIKKIEQNALSVDFWRSQPKKESDNRLITFNIETKNPNDKLQNVKGKHYLPAEIKPEHIVNREGFEVRYDERTEQPFLFKEEELAPNETKNYQIEIEDVWRIPQRELEYTRERADEAMGHLQNSQYAESAAILYDQIIDNLEDINESQAQTRNFQDHVSAYRFNRDKYEDVEETLNNLEKLLLKYRENLEVSKIKNVMQQIRSLKSLANVSRAIFDKKPRVNAAWKIIGSVMIFLGIFTIIHFLTWFLRSNKEKKLEDVEAKREQQDNEDNDKQA